MKNKIGNETTYILFLVELLFSCPVLGRICRLCLDHYKYILCLDHYKYSLCLDHYKYSLCLDHCKYSFIFSGNGT